MGVGLLLNALEKRSSDASSASSRRFRSVTSWKMTTAEVMVPSGARIGVELKLSQPCDPSAHRISTSSSVTVSPVRMERARGQSSGA